MIHPFRRDMVEQVRASLMHSFAVALLGPRACGKTVCMRQLCEDMPGTRYVSFSELDWDDSMTLLEEVRQSILQSEPILWLLDDFTYAFKPEDELEEIAAVFFEVLDELEGDLETRALPRTRIVLAGQSVSLEAWTRRTFHRYADYLRVDFLSPAEWEAATGNSSPSPCFGQVARDFHGIVSLRDYLEGCLELTDLSNWRTSNGLWDNDCEDLQVELLQTILSAIDSGQRLADTMRYVRPGLLRQALIFLSQNSIIRLQNRYTHQNMLQEISYGRYTCDDEHFSAILADMELTLCHPLFMSWE